MASVAQITFIGTSKIKTRATTTTSWSWGKYSSWKTFKNPVAASKKKIKYDKTTKNKALKSKYKGLGGETYLGTHIPATAQRTIDGVVYTCDVRYYVRGYRKIVRTSSLKANKKMLKYTYTTTHPRQYRLQYKDNRHTSTTYSTYDNGYDYIYFADFYYSGGTRHTRSGHLPHPTKFNVTLFDVDRNIDTSAANNSDGRDNSGRYVLSKVRSNLARLELEWTGLSASEGADLIDTLNPEKSKGTQKNFLLVQFRDPSTGLFRNGTFFASERKAELMAADGIYKTISVTLTEA